jgi:L-fucose mutarotase
LLKGPLLHPELLEVLARSGHGSKVLIADGNYPFETTLGPNTRVVYLNLCPGKLTTPEVLEAIAQTVPIEAAEVMVPDGGPEPPVFGEFRAILGDLKLEPISRFDFYEVVRGSDVSLVVATGERRIYANVLLTIGVVPPEG